MSLVLKGQWRLLPHPASSSQQSSGPATRDFQSSISVEVEYRMCVFPVNRDIQAAILSSPE